MLGTRKYRVMLSRGCWHHIERYTAMRLLQWITSGPGRFLSFDGSSRDLWLSQSVAGRKNNDETLMLEGMKLEVVYEM